MGRLARHDRADARGEVAGSSRSGDPGGRAGRWDLADDPSFLKLTGKRLFRGESDFATLMEVRERKIERPSRDNKAVSSDLDDIVMTALQRDPALRWQTAGARHCRLAGVVGARRVVGQRLTLGAWMLG